MLNSENMIVVYHDPCNDGFCSAYLIWQQFGYSPTYLPSSHDGTKHDLSKFIGKDVVFVDFSYPEDYLLQILSCAKSLTVLDHHKTASYLAQLIADGHINGEFDISKSGARLTLEWLQGLGYEFDDDTYDLVDYVQDDDLWKFELLYSKDVNAAISSYPKTFEDWQNMPHVSGLSREGICINRFRNELIKEHVSQSTLGTFECPGGGGYMNIPHVVCTSSKLVSDLGHELCQGHPFAVIQIPQANGVKWSLRSDENGLDVSEIAKLFGGGGHKHAAGFFVKG